MKRRNIDTDLHLAPLIAPMAERSAGRDVSNSNRFLSQSVSRALKPYIVATLTVIAAFLLKLFTPPVIVHEIPFLIFFSAVVLSGIYGGFRVGLYATLFSALLSDFFFLPPHYTLIKENWHQNFKIGLYILDCVTMCALCGSLKKALERRRKAEETLRHALEDLQEERDRRERFVSMLTHDLRTPLTAAKMSAELIHRLGTQDPPKTAQLTERVVKGLVRADRMIQDLLDVNRVSAGKRLPLRIDECDLSSMFQQAVEDLKQIHGDRFRLEVTDGQTKTRWDCEAIRRVLENLCNNGVKYGAADRPITIRVRSLGEEIELSVHNEGTPLSSEELNDLFEPFKRAQSAETGSQRGWGIGLTLVKGVVEAHAGRIRVESSHSAGTTFSILLPRVVAIPSKE